MDPGFLKGMVKSIGTIQLDKDLSNDAAGMEYGTVTILSHWELIEIDVLGKKIISEWQKSQMYPV